MNFFATLALFGRAIALLRSDNDLRRWTRISAAVSTTSFVALFAALWRWVPALVSRVWPQPSDSWALLWMLAVAFVFLVCLAVGAQTLPLLILSPILERISIAAERTQGIEAGPGNLVQETGRAALKAFFRISILLIGQVFLLVLWLVPGLGHAAWAIGTALWSMAWLAFEYVDITANRHGLQFRDVLRLLNQHGGGTFALGLGIYLVMWVPVLNVFFVPIAVVASALFYRSVATEAKRQ